MTRSHIMTKPLGEALFYNFWRFKFKCQCRHILSHVETVAALNISDNSSVRTKRAGIICTIGPASRDINVLVEMMKSGMNIARLNFSHGTHEYHLESIKNIQKAAKILSKELNRTIVIGLALDTKGPEIRTGLLENHGEEVELKVGMEVLVTTDPKYSKKVNKSLIYVDYKKIIDIVPPGSFIYIDDGLISLKVLGKERNDLRCLVENGGLLGSSKGVNLPRVKIDLPALAKKDVEDIKFAMKNNIDMIFASFVREKQGVEEIRELINREAKTEQEKGIDIIAKIENEQGVQNLHEIIGVSDGVMVARGDLGIEIPPEKVFLAQKSMIATCNLAGKPIICATQMLESMTTKPRPTRAEVSDVANAILDGADCVMLSGETAKGKFPIECVKTMAKICVEAEAVVPYNELFHALQSQVKLPTSIYLSTAIAAVAAAQKCGAAAILVLTESGATAFVVARFRPPCPIIAITALPTVARKCLLHRGVLPVLHTKIHGDWGEDIDESITKGLHAGYQQNIIHEGDKAVFMAGWKKGKGSTDTIRIISVTEKVWNYKTPQFNQINK